MARDPILDEIIPTRRMAETIARQMGCDGAHRVGEGWHPCRSNEELMTLIRGGVRELRKLRRGEKVKSHHGDKKKKRRRKRMGSSRRSAESVNQGLAGYSKSWPDALSLETKG